MNTPIQRLRYWFDAEAKDFSTHSTTNEKKIDWVRCIPFIFCHLMCFGVIWVGISPIAVLVCTVSYLLRIFAITAFYHRYFSHRAFQTSRFMQCIFAILGAAAVQRGALWWAAHHRAHHKYTDQPADNHSPYHHGFLWSHFGWFTNERNFYTQNHMIKDLLRYPELVWLNRFDSLIPFCYAVVLFLLGKVLAYAGYNTSGGQLLIWGFFISTILLYHATFSVNSIGHMFGSRTFNTKDHSRNNWLVALLTFGEGWHNNHHYWPSSVRQGFKSYEIDVSFYLLMAMEKLGLIWNMRKPPKEVLSGNPVLSK